MTDEHAERQRMLATLDLIIALATIELELEERSEVEKQRTRELLPPQSPRRHARWHDPNWKLPDIDPRVYADFLAEAMKSA